MSESDFEERLAELHDRNDAIEREVAKINKHYRRESLSPQEQQRKDELLTELNNVICEIELLEATHHEQPSS